MRSQAQSRPRPRRRPRPTQVEEERDVVLRSGSTLRLRPIRPRRRRGSARLLPADVPRQPLLPVLLAAAASTPSRPREFCRVDYDQQFVMVGECGGPLVAVAHYFRAPEPSATAPRSPSPSRTRCRGAASARACWSGWPRSRATAASRLRRRRARREPADDGRVPQLRLRGAQERRAGGVEQSCCSIAPDGGVRRALGGALAEGRVRVDAAVLRAEGRRRHRRQPRARQDRRRDLPQPPRDGFRGTLVPVNPTRRRDRGPAGYPTRVGRPGPGGPRRDRRARRARRRRPSTTASRRASTAIVVITAGFGETGDGGAPPRGGAAREGPRRRHPDGRPQLHGPHQHRSGGSA